MKTESKYDIDNRQFISRTSVTDCEMAATLDAREFHRELMYQVATGIANKVMERLEPALNRALAEMSDEIKSVTKPP